MTLFLANALRESWEEIRLSPFNIQFLGPLPCHSLILFRRTIFPLVGLVKKEPSYRTNREVERIVEIPIKSFFQADNYAHYLIETADSIKHSDQTSWQFPCFFIGMKRADRRSSGALPLTSSPASWKSFLISNCRRSVPIQ